MGERQEPSIIAVSRPFLRTLDRAPDAGAVEAAAGRLWAACRRLQLPMPAYSTALLYFQRFLVLGDIEQAGHDAVARYDAVAAACLVVALKTEGSPKKLEIVEAAMQLAAPARTLELERQILELNAFDFRIAHAHRYVVRISKNLELAEPLARRAWDVATDAYETSAVLQYPAHTVALGAICVMARLCGIKLRVRDTRLLGSGAAPVRGVMRALLRFYTDRTAAARDTHARLAMAEPEFAEWLAANGSAPAATVADAPAMPNAHQISLEGVARYRPKTPQSG